MSAFSLSFTAVQSTDATQIVITDTSPWGAGSNDENYIESQFTRELILTDALDNAITTIALPTGTNSVTYDVPENTNPWINIDYNAVGPVTLDKVQRYGFQRYYELAYFTAIKRDCGCCGSINPQLNQVDNFYQGAELSEPVGDAESWQQFVDSAYLILTTPV